MDNQSQSHKLLTRLLLSQLQSIHRPDPQDTIPPPPYSFHPSNTETDFSSDEEEEEEPPTLPPLTIKISTPITISGTSNLILLPPSTTLTTTKPRTTKLVETILEALKSVKGVPMVDENGNLRPVTLEIDNGIRIEGKGNLIGVGCGVKRGLVGRMRGEEGEEGKEEKLGKEGVRGKAEFVGDGGELRRKRRAGSAPVGERYVKREKID